ncbi:3-oxoacyl-[acyl-carrier-protein] reductase [Allisonella histaminiformans]|uniref:3-oxoacyl-[acyl-carrier-protein] reductase n=1 Tax=Allisonella histaminiformans TaxID=209880 RepID=UPI0028042AAA|nr:3-oxoacyl-[acyl-carrier-protein] reductase [Allisonella histaminiformans]
MENIAVKTALVTGASRGIGAAIAKKLAARGFMVIINYGHSSAAAEEVKNQIEQAGGQAVLMQGDVSSGDDVDRMFKDIKKTWGRLDVLVNNAGINRDTLLVRMKEDQWDAVLSTDLKSVFFTTKAAASLMMRQRSGSIINIASVVGITGNAGQANYAAAKAGVIGFTKSAAKELAARGIRVNAIAPGFIETDMTDAIPEKIREGMLETIPLRRGGKAEDVANAVAFLASDDAGYITGQVLKVDGGMVM